MRNLLVLLFALGVFISKTNASHVYGGTISYTYISDSVYDFYFNFYRSCNGVAFTNPTSGTRIKCKSGGDSASISLSLVSITNVSFLCNSAKNPCYPVNTGFTGEGMEKHVYKGRIDFTTTQYKTLYSCGDLIVESGQCCRPGNYSSISPAFYIYALFNPSKNPKNSSPVFSQNPRNLVCCNTPTKLNFEASDRDGDSLSYSLEAPLNSWNNYIKYSGSYSASQPIRVYDPTGKGVVNPNANPPTGFYLGKYDGQVVFTPTGCTDNSPVVVVVKEWRKDTSGSYIQIGTFIRDIFIQVITCKANNIPSIAASFSYYLCEGDSLSFVIKSDDKVVVPPPPKSSPAPDTVSLSWNGGITGATFKVISDTALHQSAIFEWRTPKGSDSTKPYSFLVFAKDNNCPHPATNFQRINVYVNKNLAKTLTPRKIACGTYALQTNYDSNSSMPNLLWNVLDTSGFQILDSLVISFKSNKTYKSSLAYDTVIFHKAGKYYVTLTASTDSCSATVVDTVLTSGEFDPVSIKDTLVCSGNAFAIIADSSIASHITKYKWKNRGSTQTGRAFNGTQLKGISELTLEAEAHDGCIHFDTIAIGTIYKPLPNDIGDTTICETSLTNFHSVDRLDSGNVKNSFLWSTGDTSNTSFPYFDTRMHWVRIQNRCGSTTDSFYVQADSAYFPNLLSNRILCDKDSFLIGDTLTRSDVAYQWNTGATSSFIYVTTSGKYKLTGSNACYVLSDSVQLDFSKSPKLNWPDTSVYCDQVDDVFDALNSGSSYLWHDGSTKQTYVVDKEGWFKVTVTTVGCGSTLDSTFADLILSPVVDLGNDTSLTMPFTLILDGGGSDAKYLWNTGETTQTITVTNYGTYWVEHSNVCDTLRDSISVSLKDGIERHNRRIGSIVPNPSFGTFIIRSDAARKINLLIFNNLGQVVEFDHGFVNGGYQVDIQDPLPGIYHLDIKVGGLATRKRLVIL